MFQQTVNNQPAPGVEGTRASNNPIATYVAGPGALLAGSLGCIVGRFAWTPDEINVNNFGTGVPGMFIPNEQQGLNLTYLSQGSLSVIAGTEVTGITRGDYWMKFAAGATKGQKVFASMVDGTARTGAAGSTVQGIAITASTATNVLTVTAGAGLLPNMSIAGASIPASTYIVAQTSGTTGGAGTYTLSTTPGTVGSEAMTASAYIETLFSALSTAAAGELAKIGFGN